LGFHFEKIAQNKHRFFGTGKVVACLVARLAAKSNAATKAADEKGSDRMEITFTPRNSRLREVHRGG
jgi:hypothetical protein